MNRIFPKEVKFSIKEEIDILEKEFQKNPKPSSSTKAQLAAALGIERPRNWFQNRRAKQKHITTENEKRKARRATRRTLSSLLSMDDASSLRTASPPVERYEFSPNLGEFDTTHTGNWEPLFPERSTTLQPTMSIKSPIEKPAELDFGLEWTNSFPLFGNSSSSSTNRTRYSSPFDAYARRRGRALPPMVVDDPNDTAAMKRARNTLATRNDPVSEGSQKPESRSLVELTDMDRLPLDRARRNNSDDATMSTGGGYNDLEEVDFPMEETSDIRSLRIGQKRRASSPLNGDSQPEVPTGGAPGHQPESEYFPRRRPMSHAHVMQPLNSSNSTTHRDGGVGRGSPTPRLSLIPPTTLSSKSYLRSATDLRQMEHNTISRDSTADEHTRRSVSLAYLGNQLSSRHNSSRLRPRKGEYQMAKKTPAIRPWDLDISNSDYGFAAWARKRSND
ncbi:hypothetical protein F5B22DRAFT_650820 [Xylaria bambusicola]|uniref:uncharacterized protein n=1 Tax=Xylaria bambusicola TaxID=326684 RepID=UPI002008942B|nr:uncharacterized protein F5B22DRAFT_650820 [Xylaria bambusicola]KAI0506428.1 hypothetical protein F5B22DRAFT_650820 [Xylaria bambusicola]